MWFSVSDLVTSLWLRYGRFVVFACFSYVYVQPDCKWWPATNGTPQYHHVETVRDCWRLLPSRFSSDLPYALCGSQFYPLEKIELTGLRNNTWNMELNGPLAEISEPQSQQEMRAERKAEREARLKMFRRPRDQIVTKWSGTLSHCHEHLRLIKWGHICFWHGMCDLFVFSFEIGWWMFICCCVVLRCWNLSGIAYKRDRHDSRVNIVPVGVQRRGPPNGPGFAESAPKWPESQISRHPNLCGPIFCRIQSFKPTLVFEE